MIFARTLFTGTRFVPDARVLVTDGRIASVEENAEPQPGDLVLDSATLVPGLVDLQINAVAGVHFSVADQEGFQHALSSIARTGTTSCLPTVITAEVESLLRSLVRIAEARAVDPGPDEPATRIIGAHVEGPFLSERRRGAHSADLMRDATPELIDRFLAHEVMVMMTLAPEREGGMAAIEQLADRGIVVSLGHTDATAAQVHEAAGHGARMITHLFNAQRPLGHREPGVPGAALVDGRLHAGLIADLHHVAPDIVRLAFATAGSRIVLVTDALASTGMPRGTYELGGDSIVIEGAGQPARRLDGTLAGSALSLVDSVRNCIGLGIDPASVLKAASSEPAALVGRTDIGVIEAGAHADLVWLSEEYVAEQVWIGGHPVMTESISASA